MKTSSLSFRPPVYLMVILLYLVSFSSNANNTNPSSIKFSHGNFDKAKSQASEEGKLLFVDFHASWCTPCKWMDQTTFTDSDIVSVMNQNFVPLKIDIDGPEGFDLKEKYEIRYLPTILIFNSNGKMVERVEETLTAEQLLVLMEMHNSPVNKRIITHNYNTSPRQPSENDEEEDSFTISPDEYSRYISSDKDNYKLQVGVFRQFEGAHNFVNRLNEQFMEPIIVLNDYRQGEVLFKVMMGQFETMPEAESYRKILKNEYGIDSIIY